jgi:fructose-1,6-bisphosphatase
MTDELLWKTEDKDIKITNLEELLATLIKIPQGKIDKTVAKNKSNLKVWLENNFPTKLQIVAHIDEKDMTPQQLRERLIRDLEN